MKCPPACHPRVRAAGARGSGPEILRVHQSHQATSRTGQAQDCKASQTTVTRPARVWMPSGRSRRRPTRSSAKSAEIVWPPLPTWKTPDPNPSQPPRCLPTMTSVLHRRCAQPPTYRLWLCSRTSSARISDYASSLSLSQVPSALGGHLPKRVMGGANMSCALSLCGFNRRLRDQAAGPYRLPLCGTSLLSRVPRCGTNPRITPETGAPGTRTIRRLVPPSGSGTPAHDAHQVRAAAPPHRIN